VQPSLYTELAGVTPVRPDPFTLPSVFHYSQEMGSRRRAILSQLVAAWMIDPHDELVRAWKALHPQQGAAPAAALAEFLAPPCTEEELLADAAIHDPVRRTALVNEWQNEALHRFREIAAGGPGR